LTPFERLIPKWKAQATANQISITKANEETRKLFATMLAVIQKFNQVSSLQGQLIATQDRSLRAERRSDELEDPTAMPNRQVQLKGGAIANDQ
jgi:hypothetical protein